MPIRSATRDKAEKARQRAEAMCVFGAMPRVPNLEPVETHVDESSYDLASAVASRVREYRQTTTRVHESNRIGD